MKKRVLYIISLLLCMVILASCGSGADENATTTSEMTEESTTQRRARTNLPYAGGFSESDLVNPRVAFDKKHYKLLRGDFNNTYYYIYDNDKKILDEGGFIGNEPSISLLDENTIEMRMGVGTGTIWRKYYSLTRDCMSKVYWNEVAYENERIIHMDEPKENVMDDRRLVVRNVFDKSECYKEFKLDFTEDPWPIGEAKFINNGTQVQIKYTAGEKGEEYSKTVILDLF